MHRERRFGRDRRSDGLSGRLLSELEVPRSKERTSSPLANGACNAAGAHHVWPVSGLGLSREISAAMSALGFRWFPSHSFSLVAGFHPAPFLASGATRDSGPRRSRLHGGASRRFRSRALRLFAAASTSSATRPNQLQWILGE
ncbi:unnamed protein product [Ixodes pacificus]